jgi:hypothetical protein
VIDPSALRLLLLVITGWLDRHQRDAIAYLIEENRLCFANTRSVSFPGGLL